MDASDNLQSNKDRVGVWISVTDDGHRSSSHQNNRSKSTAADGGEKEDAFADSLKL